MRWTSGALSRALLTVAATGALLISLAAPADAASAASPTSGAAAPVSTGPVSACATLGQGTSGPAVVAIQTLVGATADGAFGPQTVAALSKWQAAAGIPATGVVDAATWAAMPTATAEGACGLQIAGTGFTVGCAVLSEGDTGPAVAVLEAALDQPVDDEFSAAVGQALSAAQLAARLPQNATTSRATWKALGLTGTPACTPGSTTPTLPKDYQAQQKVRGEVATLAAELLQQPGTTTNQVALAAVAFAKQQVGKPYEYGAVGPSSYDCSGLQLASYLQAGLTLPRVAADQYAGAGPTVPLDQAEAGDLLFFASDVTQPATVYHVAMYLGGGQVLDAPHTGANVGIRQLWTTDLLPLVVRPAAGLSLPLRSGATGWSVLQLQQVLDRLGAELTVDGGFGPSTKAAVKAWQVAHQLAPTGVVRLATWLSLIAPNSSVTTTSTSTSNGAGAATSTGAGAATSTGAGAATSTGAGAATSTGGSAP